MQVVGIATGIHTWSLLCPMWDSQPMMLRHTHTKADHSSWYHTIRVLVKPQQHRCTVGLVLALSPLSDRDQRWGQKSCLLTQSRGTSAFPVIDFLWNCSASLTVKKELLYHHHGQGSENCEVFFWNKTINQIGLMLAQGNGKVLNVSDFY